MVGNDEDPPPQKIIVTSIPRDNYYVFLTRNSINES